MKDRIIAGEQILTDATTNQSVATIMQQVAVLMYTDIVNS